MKKRALRLASVLLVLLPTLILAAPCWSQSLPVAYTRYKWGGFYASPGCCFSILAQDYDCLGQRKIQANGTGCYNTGSGDTIYGTCGGGCVVPTCGGTPTKLCVINQPNIGCGNCDVFLSPMRGSPPANCTTQVDPACGQIYGCGTPGGWPCYTQPFDGSADLDSGFLCDKRSAEMIAGGCRPDAVLSCLSIETFAAEAAAINLSAGQKANFTGSISSAPGGTISWSITVAGKVLTGSGNSITGSWDGKDSGEKQVTPGRYEATLEVRASGASCNARDSKTLSIEAKAHDEPVACAVDPGIPFESAANVATGSLVHEQTLFSLPNSRFRGDFTLAYNSLSGQKTPLGTGWSHTFDIHLSSNNNGTYTLTEGDGRRTTLYPNGNRFTPENATFPFLTFNQDGTSVLEKKEGIFYAFDGQGRIARILDRNSNAVAFTYDAKKNLTLITDSSGRSISLAYNADNRISQITDPYGNIHSFTYAGTALAGISSQVEGLGIQAWAYTYDPMGFLLTKTDPKGYVTSYLYDPEFRVAQATDPEGRTRSIAYQPEASTSQLTEKDGGVWIFRYDPGMGALTEKTDPLGNISRYTYDQNRNLASITDPNGHQTFFTHDVNGNLASITDARGNVTLYAFNSLNQVTGIAYPGDALISLAYDEKGNLTSVTDPLGNQTLYGHDSKGNLLSVVTPLGQRTTLAYDTHDYLISLTDPAGAVTSLGYDASGLLVSYEDPLKNKTAFEYNGLNQITRVTDPKGNSESYAYDLNGNLIERTDAQGRKTLYEYNYRGQVARITDALGQATRLSYGSGCPACTGMDRLTSLTDPRGKVTVFEYDLSGRLVKETSPMGYAKSYTRDRNGNRLSLTDENGNVTLYAYDPLDRLRFIRYPHGETTTFDYDDRGNLTRAANPNISYTFTYDLNNRLTGVSDSLGREILYEYDALGKRTRMTGPDRKTISYQYDMADRLIEILTSTGTFAFSYDLAGRRTSLSSPNGIQTEYTYDPSGYLTSLTAGMPQKPKVSSTAYAHDTVGNRAAMTDLSGIHEYGYDPIDQLTRAAHPQRPLEQYQYDPAGNRQNAVVDSDNALLEDGDFVYSYDNRGNRIEKTSKITGGKITYAYDADNQLAKVETQSTLAQYKYDPFGRRIEKEVNGQITRYFYDGPNILLEYDRQDNIKSSYLHTLGVDDPLALEQNGKTYYYHKDGLGSIQALTDEGGKIIQSYEYAGFGEITSQSGTVDQPFTFTGRELDRFLAQEESTSWISYSTELKPGVRNPRGMKGGGRIEIKTLRQTEDLYYFRARYYDPRAGRFLTKDPIGFAAEDTNLYRYVRNNPVNYRDPKGLFWAPWHGGITFVAAIVEGRRLAESYGMAKESWHRDDNTQGTWREDTNVHAMAGWDPELVRMQMPHEAIRGAMQIAADESACGRHGSAMHTLQDLSVYWHAGQEFTTLNPLEDPKMLVHYVLDVLPPLSSVVEAFQISRRYLQQQRGR